jgi:Tol biopolymer transport system component
MRRLQLIAITNSTFCTLFILFTIGCSDDEYKEVYLPGDPIEGIKIFFPLGFYDAEPLMPKISPDGKKLLFTGPSSLPDWKGLWVMDLETQVKTLVHPNGSLGDWAPDSEWIVFNIGTEIYKININGTGLKQLTYPIEVSVDGLTYSSNSFSPDWGGANQIAYYLSIDFRTNESGTRVVTNDGEELVKNIQLSQPNWHPTENKLIGIRGISSNSSETRFPIYDLTANIEQTVLLSVHDEFNKQPQFSPSGEKILFYNRKGIHILNLGQQQNKRIIPNHLYNSSYKGNPNLYSAYPSWHPDGEHIIYEHFEIIRSKRVIDATHVEGYIRFYKVNVNDALAISNLSL